MYADDHSQRLAYNLGGAATRTNLNWAAGVLDWELSPDNTNLAYLTEAALGSYVAKVSSHLIAALPTRCAARCKREAGWSRPGAELFHERVGGGRGRNFQFRCQYQ